MDQAVTLAGAPAAPAGERRRSATLAVENMRCGGCMRAVEKALVAVSGVRAARANLSARRVSVDYDAGDCTEADLVAALGRAGFRASLMAAPAPGDSDRDGDLLRRVAVAGFAAGNIMLLSISVWSGLASDMDEAAQALFHWLSALIALPAVAYAGQPFYSSAAAALRARRLNMDVPISLAVMLATGMSLFQTARGSEQVYFDAAVTLLFLLLVGRWLDERLRVRARGEAHNLMALQQGLATVIGADGGTRTIAAHRLQPGDRLLIAAGERIPADGTVCAGAGDVDQALITGESTPVAVAPGVPVYAGTVNLSRPLQVRVSAADQNTLLAEIGRLMAAAEQDRSSYRRLADRAARLYSPAVHILGVATFGGWMVAGAAWEDALTYAIAVLIITCPCALALAVPAVQVAAAGRLFRQGVVLKAADGLERLAEIDTVVFDKTGTLTLGRPRLVLDGNVCDDDLAAAAGLAAASRHPYARALVAAAEAHLGPVVPAAGVEEVAGFGLRRDGPRGEERLGSPAWCGMPGEAVGGTVVCYRRGAGLPVSWRLEDALRPDAAEVAAALKRQGLSLVLLSGDAASAVEAASRAVGIEAWTARATPARKIEVLAAHARAGRKTLMVGDGLNDAPALAAAHASLSPATAADISQRAADLVFQGERLSPVLEALSLARRAKSMALQNFALALAYNALCVPLAMAGHVTPLVAAVAMSTSSILVTANAARLAGRRGPS